MTQPAPSTSDAPRSRAAAARGRPPASRVALALALVAVTALASEHGARALGGAVLLLPLLSVVVAGLLTGVPVALGAVAIHAIVYGLIPPAALSPGPRPPGLSPPESLLLFVLVGSTVAVVTGLFQTAQRRLAAEQEAAAAAAARAEESERRFRVIADQAPDIVFRLQVRPELRFEYVSPSSTAVVGYTPEEHYADPALGFKLVLPEDRPLLDRALERPGEQPLVVRWRRRDGRIIWTEQRVATIRDARGEVTVLEGIARDITARVEAEQQREDLLRAVSHDLRTPLNAILIQGRLLEAAAADAERTERAARIIVENARRMSRSIEEMLQMARSEDLLPRGEPVELGPFVGEMARRLFTEEEVHRLRLAVPPGARVFADPVHLERILSNLLTNAFKYAAPGTEVAVSAEREAGERVALVVADEGPGIPREELPHVFERGFRGRRAAEPGGVGLGLYITQVLVAAHGGRVSVASEPGSGTTFRVELPAAPSAPSLSPE